MKWFTIYVDGLQFGKSEEGTFKNCAGQSLAFDGKSSLEAIMQKAGSLAESWASVQVFSGKSLGRLIATFASGRLMDFNNGKALQ